MAPQPEGYHHAAIQQHFALLRNGVNDAWQLAAQHADMTTGEESGRWAAIAEMPRALLEQTDAGENAGP